MTTVPVADLVIWDYLLLKTVHTYFGIDLGTNCGREMMNEPEAIHEWPAISEEKIYISNFIVRNKKEKDSMYHPTQQMKQTLFWLNFKLYLTVMVCIQPTPKGRENSYAFMYLYGKVFHGYLYTYLLCEK